MRTIGRITKTYGFDGAVLVRSASGITEEPKQGEPVFVVTDGIPVPFFTREAYLTAPDTLIIAFDDYLTPESVAHLRGCDVCRTGGEETPDDLASLDGFTLTDRNSGLSGRIARVITNPGQLMAVALFGTKEAYIPLHPDLIISLDRRRRVIEMALPEGLVSLND